MGKSVSGQNLTVVEIIHVFSELWRLPSPKWWKQTRRCSGSLLMSNKVLQDSRYGGQSDTSIGDNPP